MRAGVPVGTRKTLVSDTRRRSVPVGDPVDGDALDTPASVRAKQASAHDRSGCSEIVQVRHLMVDYRDARIRLKPEARGYV
jgi:hypothetical protein